MSLKLSPLCLKNVSTLATNGRPYRALLTLNEYTSNSSLNTAILLQAGGEKAKSHLRKCPLGKKIIAGARLSSFSESDKNKIFALDSSISSSSPSNRNKLNFVLSRNRFVRGSRKRRLLS
jgi:hypothetical protein